jgi:bifunctional ADP-heptose synthase (sugar kinase/adenylyltransferase)
VGIYLDYKELPAVIEQRRSEGKKIVLTGGCFDIIHEGL